MIKPCGYRLVVKQDVIDEVDPAFARAKAAGLAILEQEKSREQGAIDTGVIVELGPDCWKEFSAPWAKTGDRVAFAKYAGKGIKDGDTQYLVLNDEDIVAVL